MAKWKLASHDFVLDSWSDFIDNIYCSVSYSSMFTEGRTTVQELKSFESGAFRIKVGEWAFKDDKKESVGHISRITKDGFGRILVYVDIVLDFEKGSESYSNHKKRRPKNEAWWANDVWRVDGYDEKMLKKAGILLKLQSLF